jgi:hypothetical protein
MGTVVRPKGRVQTDSKFTALLPLCSWNVETGRFSNAWVSRTRARIFVELDGGCATNRAGRDLFSPQDSRPAVQAAGQIARDEVVALLSRRFPVPPLSTDRVNQIVASHEPSDVAPGQFPRCSRPISLDNLPHVNLCREVKADNIHL